MPIVNKVVGVALTVPVAVAAANAFWLVGLLRFVFGTASGLGSSSHTL